MIKPLRAYVLIERKESVSRSGAIILPDVAQEKSILGKVLVVGPGKMDEDGALQSLDVQVGQLVYFNSKWSDLAGSHYVDDQLYNRKLHLVQEADIFLKLVD